MLESGRTDQKSGGSLYIRQIKIGETCYSFQGGSVGGLMQADFVQAYLLFSTNDGKGVAYTQNLSLL